MTEEATDLLQVTHQATRGSSDVSNKKVATPAGDGSNQSSPLLSASRKDNVTLSGKLDPQNLNRSRFSLAVVPLESSVFNKQPNVTFNDSPTIVEEKMNAEITDRLSNYIRQSGKKDQSVISQYYMSIVDNHPKETQRKYF